MDSRSNRLRFAPRLHIAPMRFEALEPRNMLAADFGIADPYTSSLITSIVDEVPVAQQMEVLRDHLNAQPRDAFQLIRHDRDQVGFEHFVYQHLHNGLPVESSRYTVHTRDGLIVSLSGEYHALVDAAQQPAIGESQALDFALQHINAHTYVWQDAGLQQQLGLHAHEDRTIHLGDDHAHDLGISFELPEADLVYADGSLAYRFDIYALQPLYRSYIFVDASNGEIVDEHSRIHDFNVPAGGPTLYDAEQAFIAEFTGADFRLHSAADAGPPAVGAVQTYDMNGGSDYSKAVDFISLTEHFGDPQHQVGNQAHFGTEQTWLYFFNEHNRDSFDNAGTPLRSFVSYGDNYVNAFWNGSFMTYGDGNGTNRGPLVSLDIVGHEITHGVVQRTAGLIYRNHSGALNESFADIFGESVENYARGFNDWLMGGDIGLNGNAGQFRNMANPNQYNDPDTYLGDYWYSGNGDNGGVHINSGVQNKWFHIMVNGESGLNDTGYTYDVTPVGMDAAAAIAYRNLSVYLTANSTYPDARSGAIQAAIDLFGVGSQEHLSTMEAWNAVGVYDLSEGFTLFPVNPRGSQVYSASTINEIEYTSDETEFRLDLDANQRITMTVAGIGGGLVPQVTIKNPDGLIIANVTAATAQDLLLIENLAAPHAGTYAILVQGGAGTSGLFNARLWLNAGLEQEGLLDNVGNNRLSDAQNIDDTAITQGHVPTGILDRLAVLGELAEGNTLVAAEDFESGFLDAKWQTFSSTPNGRIQVANDTGTGDGVFALSMDVDTAGIFNLNEAIMSVDMTNVSQANLSFSHVSFGDETHLLPGQFAGSLNGDGVAISADGLFWHTLWTGVATANGVWNDVELDLVQAANDAGLPLGENFQVKFQQYDNFPRGSDGRAFDRIAIGTGVLEDWYQFTLDADETAAVVLVQTSGTATAVDLEIYDASESLVATGLPGIQDVRSYVQNLTNPGGMTETFYVRAVGIVEAYSLLVLRNGTFDMEQGFDQNIQGLEGVLGYVSESVEQVADPDDLLAGSAVDNVFPGVLLSNAVTGGSIYATPTNSFEAPTGPHVFSFASDNDDGFQEGENELRAEFTEPQSFVSILVGSDDTLDVAFLRAYDSEGNLLQQVIGDGVPHSGSEILAIQRVTADIAYVVAAGTGGHTAPLDQLVFEDQVTDADTYLIDALTGDDIEYRVYLPGEGPFDFRNRLAQPTGPETRMILVDPQGDTVDTHERLVSHTAEMDGTYQLVVFANRFDGEYFLSTDTGVVSATAFGAKLLDGVPASGNLNDAAFSDDLLWRIHPSPTSNPAKQIVDMILLGESPVTNPSSFGFRLEASLNGGPAGDVLQVVQLWDESAKAWQVVDTRPVETSQVSLDFHASGFVDRFVHPLTREIIAKLTFISPEFSGPPFDWSIDVDQAVWSIGAY